MKRWTRNKSRSLLAAAMKALSDLSDDLKESISVDE
jgi:hypothetical protein